MKRPSILYTEMLEDNYGNKRLDIEILKSLSEFADVTVCGPANWYPDFKSPVTYEETQVRSCPPILKRILGRYWIPYHNIQAASKLNKKNQFDYIFFASYHPYISALLPVFFDRLDKIYVMNHNNIDYLDTSSKGRKLFHLYGKKINHIVFEEFISEYLIKKYGVDKHKVYIIPHPMNQMLEKYPVRYDCVGISNSNDEDWVKRIIDYEKSTNIIKNKNLKVVLRSKMFSFDDGALTVIQGYLSDTEYYKYVCSSKYIFMAFPQSFRYRMSGTIVDALSNETLVIGTDIPLINSYSDKYKGVVFCAKKPENLVEILDGQYDASTDQFIRFKELHSYKSITDALKNMLGAN